MWSRRAQEYETKINSGDINAIAEVVRDLYRSEAQPEQSYSERQLYEAALDRMVREIAAVQKSNEIDALRAVEAQLQKVTAAPASVQLRQATVSIPRSKKPRSDGLAQSPAKSDCDCRGGRRVRRRRLLTSTAPRPEGFIPFAGEGEPDVARRHALDIGSSIVEALRSLGVPLLERPGTRLAALVALDVPVGPTLVMPRAVVPTCSSISRSGAKPQSSRAGYPRQGLLDEREGPSRRSLSVALVFATASHL